MKKMFELDGNKSLVLLDKINEYNREFRGMEDDDEDGWHADPPEIQGLIEPLQAESIIEPEYEIDDFFGQYGFKNKNGDFVIEPQYAYAWDFTCGLAAVNLNRTWYRTKEGDRYYENHFGYINSRGETVIPFAYDEAWPFNKYQVAVVEKRGPRGFLIDIAGNIVVGTENLDFEHYYDYENRYLEFRYYSDSCDYDYYEGPIGIYDTKECKILLEPEIDDFIEWEEDCILIYERKGAYGYSDFSQYYINSSGEIKYPWLYGKGFAEVNRPNGKGYSIVSISKYVELEGYSSCCIEYNGKKYNRLFIYGIYSEACKFILPLEYEKIKEIAEGVYECYKDGKTEIFTAR